MEQPERLRIRPIGIRAFCVDMVNGMIVMILVGTTNQELPFSKALGEETKHNHVPFSHRFV